MGIWRAVVQGGPSTQDKSSARRLRSAGAAGVLFLFIAAVLFAVPSALSSGAAPTIASDLPDYNPGQQVTLTGSNWNPAGGPVHIVVNDNVGQTWQYQGDATPDPNGNIVHKFTLPTTFIAEYRVDATQGSLSATTTFTDANPSADIDQCANDPAPSAHTDGCSASASDWVNGNIGASKAVYLEGDSLPYRLRFDNLSLAAHAVTIEWDTTKSSKHALDYITTVNQTVATANPCLGVSGCNPASFNTFAIPADPQVTGAGVTPIAGNLRLYGGTITGVSAYSYPDGAGFVGDKSAQITIQFTASVANPVLAWAGHISARADWGLTNSAVAISGSPYHTRLIDLDGSGGNQDRSLSADAVIFPGSITVIKQATPEGSTSFGYTASPAPLSNFSLVDDGTSTNTKVFSDITNFQTYTVNESSIPSGWGFDSLNCAVTSPNGGSFSTSTTTATINMAEGENYTCTYANSIRQGTLIVKKHVVNDNGGTKVASDFTLHVKSGSTDVTGSPAAGSESGTSYTLSGGTYNVSENAPPAGYTQTGISGDCDASGNVTVVAGQTKTCTITNTDIAPKLHLRKLVTNDNGGTAVKTDWTLNADGTGSNDLSGTDPVDSGAGLQADTWALSETNGPSGYSAGAWNCVGGTQNGSNITVGIGGEATCTITNNDIAPQLHLRKVVLNNNGGTAVKTDWTLNANGSGTNDLTGTDPVDSDGTLQADTWALSETNGPAGYSAGDWNCSGGTQVNSNITVGIGQSATCTIVNNDIAPKLHLRKIVVNDNGGTAVKADFTLTANGTGTNDLSGTDPVDSGPFLQADTWALSETGPANYVASDWDCVGGTQNGANITVGIGGEATCTITNDDSPPGLHLRKIVVNNNGGTAVKTDWTLTADGTGSNDLSGTDPVDSGPGLQADTFALSESGPANYSASAWVCVGGSQNGSNITIAQGESATCTITNNDIPPKLHLRKIVVNDNGGTATTANFTLTANGTGSNDLSGTSPVDSGGTLQADTWALSETSPAGYSASAWDCVGGTQNGSNITVGIGGEATCTITNDDIAPKLHLRKVVVNNNGGTATVADFTLTADGTNGNDLSGTSPVDSGPSLKADTWALSETNLPNYTAGSWSCVGGNQNGANITVGIGGEATCTITNTDVAPKLHLRNVVFNDNGGTNTVADFTLTADGTGSNDLTGTSPVDSGNGLQADTWALSETTVPGYNASSWNCVGGDQNGANITLGIGGEATCTITNNDIAPKLHLRKVVVNDNGGTKTVADFTLTADGTNGNDLSGTSPVDSGGGLKADTFALSETNVYGYDASAWSCTGDGNQNGSNIPVGLADEATCTITNNDKPATLIVKKIIKPTGSSQSFQFDTTGTGYNGFSLAGGQQNSQQLNAGSYTAKELVPNGWILTGIGGSSDPNTPYNCTVTGSGGSSGVGSLQTQTVSVTLKIGDTVTCVFENTGTLVTRTQGFWATHPQLANIAWFGGTAFGHTFSGVAAVAGIGDRMICGRELDTLGKVMGAFWSSVSKKTTGAKRTALDQARMQLLQQLIAAELNGAAFGSTPSNGSFAAWETALCGTNVNAIKNAASQAASFNTAGDSGTFTPGTSADSKTAKSIANKTFWNIIKP